MTKSSKRSVHCFFDTIDRRSIKASWFMTCTLPASFACSAVEFKRILGRYFAALTRAWGDSAAWYWVIEVTEQQQWHVHMLWMWVKNPQTDREKWEKFRDWNDLVWHRSTRVTDPRHQRVACQIKPVRHFEKTLNYMIGQYFTPKKWEHYTGGPTGRVHGVRNAWLLDPVVEETAITPGAAALLRRAAGRLRQKRFSGFFWIKEGKKRERVELPDMNVPGIPNYRRHLVKTLGRMAIGREKEVRFKRCKTRSFMNAVEWEDEFQVGPTGRETHIGVVPHRVLSAAECEAKPFTWFLNKKSGRWEKKWHSAGDAAPSYAFGPSDLRIPWEQAQRLIAWAIKEDRRRSQIRGELPF